MKTETLHVLRRKSDGWYVSPGSKHTSDPKDAIVLDQSEIGRWLKAWGRDYEAVEFNDAKEVE